VVAQGALGLEVVACLPVAAVLASRLGVLGAQPDDALQLGLGQGQLLLALLAVAFGLLGVVAQHEPAGPSP
jgi:hypothetical protein